MLPCRPVAIRAWLVASALGLLALGLPAAQAQGVQPVRIGIALPGLPLSTGARKQLGLELAAALGRALGTAVDGRSYANVADLERELDHLTLVLVESPVAATLRAQPVMVGLSQGRGDMQIVLFGPGRSPPEGAPREGDPRLGHPRYGRASQGIIDSLLFDGDPMATRFPRVVFPDLPAGIAALGLRKIDYLVGPATALDAVRSTTPRAQILLRTPRIPGPTLAIGGAPGARQAFEKAQGALASFSSQDGVIQGFRPTSQADHRSLARLLSGKARRSFLLIEPALPVPDIRVRYAPPPSPRPPVEAYLGAPE